tara:strand:- start:508 stop:1029 length:522 start_codon:yes stop_codon:yes gene_type:complete
MPNKTNYKKLWELEQSRTKKKQDELDLVLKGYKNLLREYENMKVMLQKADNDYWTLHKKLDDKKILDELRAYQQMYPEMFADVHPSYDKDDLGKTSKKKEEVLSDTWTYKDIDEMEYLSPSQKKIYKEFRYNSQSYTTTGKKLNKSPQNVRQIVRRIENKIKLEKAKSLKKFK